MENKFSIGDSVKIIDCDIVEEYRHCIGDKSFIFNYNKLTNRVTSKFNNYIFSNSVNDYGLISSISIIHTRIILTEKVRPEFK